MLHAWEYLMILLFSRAVIPIYKLRDVFYYKLFYPIFPLQVTHSIFILKNFVCGLYYPWLSQWASKGASGIVAMKGDLIRMDKVHMSDWVTVSYSQYLLHGKPKSSCFKPPWAVGIQLPVLDPFSRQPHALTQDQLANYPSTIYQLSWFQFLLSVFFPTQRFNILLCLFLQNTLPYLP